MHGGSKESTRRQTGVVVKMVELVAKAAVVVVGDCIVKVVCSLYLLGGRCWYGEALRCWVFMQIRELVQSRQQWRLSPTRGPVLRSSR